MNADRAVRPRLADEDSLADDDVRLTSDVILCRLRASGRPWRTIARVLGRPESSIRHRWHAIEPDIRSLYAKTPV